MACGSVGHWYKDQKECQEKMRAVRKEQTPQPAQEDPTTKNEKPNKNTPFHVAEC